MTLGLAFAWWAAAGRRAAAAPLTPQEYIQDMIDCASDVFYIIGPDGKIIFASQALERITGWSPREWVGKPFIDIIAPEDREFSMERFRLLSEGKQPPQQPYRVRKKDGGIWWADFRTSFLRDGDRITGMAGIVTDVTKQMELAAALNEKENFLRDLFYSIQDGISVLNTRHEIQQVNHVMEKLFPHAVPLIGKKCHQAYHGRPIPCDHCPSRETLKTKQPSYAVVPLNDAERRDVGRLELFTYPLLDSVTGELKGVIEFVRDISNRVRMEAALIDSLKLSADVMNSIPSGMLVFHFHAPDRFGLSAANQVAEQMLGVTAEENRLQDIGGIWPALNAPSERERLLRVMQIGQVYQTGELPHADGRCHILRCFRMPEQRLGVIFEDITEKKAVREALDLAEQKLHHLVEQSLFGLCMYQDGRFVYANARFAEIFGFTLEEIYKLPSIFQLLDDASLEHMSAKQARRLDGETVSPREQWRGRHRDGRLLLLESYVKPAEYQGKPAVIGSVLDVTESKRLEEELRQAQRLEALGRLAGGVAHDFNNLLMVISGYCELLEKKPGADRDTREILSEIAKATQRGSSLTRQLLAYSRRQMLQPTVVDLNAIIQDMRDMLGRMLGEDIRVELDLAPDTARIKADAGNMQQILMNLAVNARDALPGGGGLCIRTDNCAIDVAAAGADIRPGRYVRLVFSDNGMGMDAGIKDHIFDPFFSTKDTGKGTGLGLAVVYGIVRQHEGWIRVDSHPGQGTSFEIAFPRYEGPVMPAAAESRPAPPEGKSQRILLVEDDRLLCRFVHQALQEAGYAVDAAESAQEALDLVRQDPGRVDVLLTDVVLKDKSGLWLADEVQKFHPGIRIIYTSGYADLKGHGGQIQQSQRPFLQKPYPMSALLQLLHELLAGDR